MSHDSTQGKEKDLMDKMLQVLSESERRELTKIMADDLRYRSKKMRQWTHPIYVSVLERYHQCAGCGDPIGDECIVVVFRERGGDKIVVFDRPECLDNYVW